VQWRAVLRPSGRGRSLLDSVVLNYRPKNVAPVIEEVVVQPGQGSDHRPNLSLRSHRRQRR